MRYNNNNNNNNNNNKINNKNIIIIIIIIIIINIYIAHFLQNNQMQITNITINTKKEPVYSQNGIKRRKLHYLQLSIKSNLQKKSDYKLVVPGKYLGKKMS